MQNKLLRYVFFFLIFLILLQLFSPKKQEKTNTSDAILLSSKSSFVIGNEVIIGIQNKSGEVITIKNQCPKNPLMVEYYQNGEWINKEALLDDTSYCSKYNDTLIEPEKNAYIKFSLWSTKLFDKEGKYRVIFNTTVEGKTKTYNHEIDIVPPSFIKRIWNALLYKPIFNTLIFFVSKLPGHSLGWAIILLTLIIKIILLGPNQKALKSQKQLQLVQPQLDALKEKYKNDSQRLAQETMAIWKKHKVNPMGSCLPMLIQFPVLIALFYVVRDSLNVMDPSLFYEPLKDFSLKNVNTVFLGLMDLTKVNLYVLPIIVGGLQFLQIRLSFAKAQKNTSNAAAPMMNKMMQFFLPGMIAVFSASLPAAVGFYWGVSTIFAIGQQLVVNRSKTGN